MNREADPAVALLSYTAPATNLAMVREKMSLAENCRKLPYSPLFSSSRASLRASSSCGSAGWAPSSRVKTTTLHFRESWVNSTPALRISGPFLVGSLCCAAWFKYGLIVGDEAVYRVNALGLALHLGYVSCYAAYASKPARRSVVHPIKMNFCCCSTAELAAAAVEVAIFFSAFSSYSVAAAVVVVVSAAAVAAAISFTVGNSAAAAIAAAAIAAEASIIFTMVLLLSLQLLLLFTAAATFTIFFAHVASPTASASVAEICPLPAVSA